MCYYLHILDLYQKMGLLPIDGSLGKSGMLTITVESKKNLAILSMGKVESQVSRYYIIF